MDINNGLILQYGFHDHGYNQDIFKDVITFPISYYNVIIVIITQKDVAQVVGVNVSTYKHYELGDRCAPLVVIRDLANFYKISTDYFFENMPELSTKEELEISRRAFDVSQNKSQMIGDIRNFAEGMAKLEEKVQARARLRVKKYRLDNKKSQQEVADYLGIDISTYNKYEKGSRKLNNEVVRKIAEYYNIKVSDILD